MKAKYFRFWFGQVLLGLLLSCIALLDPFGLSTSSDNASSQWINRITASLYPTTGQKEVVVVLIDDAYLMQNSTFWPLPYAQQSLLFKRLLAYKPKAVFVDLMYSHDHSASDVMDGGQLLANVFERYQRQGIPLLLANSGSVRGQNGEANTLASLAGLGQPALVKWSDVGDQYPLAVDTSLGLMETPAMGLYRQYCGAGMTCRDLPEDAAAAHAKPPVALRWGRELSPLQHLATSVANCSVAGNSLFEQLLQAMFWKIRDSGQATCAYTLTLKASALEASSPEDRALLTRMLSDKLVLVGAQITSAGDLIQTPVHGLLPGVYLHAMALDNLISYGMEYQHEPAAVLGPWTWVDLAQLAFVILIVGGRARFKRRRNRLAKKLAGPFFWWAAVLVLLVGLGAWLWLMNITSANVLAIALLSLSIISDHITQLIKRAWRATMRWCSRGSHRIVSYCKGIQG